MNQKLIDGAAAIVKENTAHGGETGFGFCAVSLIDEEGYPTASIMTPAKADGIRQLTFGTMLDQNRAKRIAACSRASVCFGTAEYCINLVGDMEILTHDAIKQEMWYDGLSFHFTGPDDPNYCVLRFTTKRCKLFLNGEEAEGTL